MKLILVSLSYFFFATFQMARKFDAVSDITPLKESWRLRVRIVRLWVMPGFEQKDTTNSLEMILIDEQVIWLNCYDL